MNSKAPTDYPVKPVSFTHVQLNDNFFAPRIETNRRVTIPYAFEQCKKSGRMDLFVRAGKALRSEPFEDKSPPGYPFDDTDIYKVIEGASYALSVKEDPELEAYLDDLIDLIAGAQEPDGYLYCTRTINPDAPHAWAGKDRWVLEQDNSHELYNLGHLYEAAAAHYQATGKRSLLNIAIKSADLLVKTFLEPRREIWPGHQVIEIGLVKLYRIVGQQEYLDLSQFLLDSRGSSGEYWQAHKPVTEQKEAVGHAVRATYMYAGMADVAALQENSGYLGAIESIWSDVIQSKYYITGGIGSTGAGEAFGKPYELPNMTAYCETCAQIGNCYWNHRLFLLYGQAKYMDVFERTLYNGLLSGVSLDGKLFFYPNPLESMGQHSRSPWFGCACCPSNITRFMASIPGYFYAQAGDSLFVNLYATGKADIQLDHGQRIQLTQETNYPWDGEIKLFVDLEQATNFKIYVRIPGWSLNEVVPSDLYSFEGSLPEPTIAVNKKNIPLRVEDGYIKLDRLWKAGDEIILNLPMPARQIKSDYNVEMNRGRVAVQRGPIVYCAEGVDNEGSVRNLLLPEKPEFQLFEQPEFLGGVVTLRTTATNLAQLENGDVQKTSKNVTLIPYYAWANRGPGELLVWMPNRIDAAKAAPMPTIATKATIVTSGGVNEVAINDGAEPAFMGDSDNIHFHWWPKKGTLEWVEMTFDEEATVCEVMLYWFDDTGHGECRVPESWKLLYMAGDQWKPVENACEYGVKKDQPNKVGFTPVTTSGLRLEVQLRENWSSGIWEWSVK